MPIIEYLFHCVEGQGLRPVRKCNGKVNMRIQFHFANDGITSHMVIMQLTVVAHISSHETPRGKNTMKKPLAHCLRTIISNFN